MFERIVNTMFHGSLRAKLFLWSVFVLILVTVMLAVFAAALGSATLWAGAAVSAVAAFVTSQSASLTQLERKDQKLQRQKEQLESQEKEEKESGKWDGWYSPEREKAKAQYFASMNKHKFRGIAKEHKITQKHVFAMVDIFPAEKLRQAPAIVWRTDTHLHILTMDQEAREFEVPFQDIQGIYYDKNVTADPDRDYALYHNSNFMTQIYKPYLPTYKEMTRDGELIYVKNLFSIYPGISFTNTSVRGLLQILTRVPFLVEDAINTSARFDEYFKEIYRWGILCKNDVYTLEEYREKLEQTLDALLEAPVTREEFFRSLNSMNKYHLITQDYVMRYTQRYVTRHETAH